MFRPSEAKRAACWIGTIFERLVPCRSGSSNRTLRIPCSPHAARTWSTDTDLSSAIIPASTPNPVVPNADVQIQAGGKRFDLGGSARRNHHQYPALAAIPSEQRCGHHARRLQVMAIPPERRIGVVHVHERAPLACYQAGELHVVAHIPVWGRIRPRPACQLVDERGQWRMAAPETSGPEVG